MIFEQGSTPPIFDLATPSLGLLLSLAREKQTPLGFRGLLAVALGACDRLCDGLAHQNARGAPSPILHGKLSPASIVPDRDGSVQLRHEAFSMVVRGDFPAAPEYRARERPAPAQDVYGLALVLYESVAGPAVSRPQLPEQRSDARRPALYRVDWQLPPASSRGVAPAALDAVLACALEVDPQRRYPDAVALRAALRKVADEVGLVDARAEVAAMMATHFPPEREKEHRAKVEGHLDKAFSMAVDATAQWAEAKESPVQAVGEPATEEELAEFDDCMDMMIPTFAVASTFDDHAGPPEGLQGKEAVVLLTELVGLGFERLGIKVETEVLSGKSQRAVAFASQANGCHASVYVHSTGAASVVFSTAFVGRRVVWTRNLETAPVHDSEYVITGNTGTARRVLEQHRSEVAAFVTAGNTVVDRFDRQTLLEATDDYYDPPLPER